MDTDTDIDHKIHSWAMAEVMPWRMRCIAASAIPDAAAELNTTETAYIFTIREGGISVESKLGKFANVAHPRSRIHLDFFHEVLRVYPSIPDTTFILDIGDMPPPSPNVPVFQFQKPADAFSILLPDIDFIGWNYYTLAAIVDTAHYAEKALSAIFVGGTSGQLNTVETVRNPVASRLRSAKYFRGHPDIRFLLPKLCQCANPEAERALRDLGFGGPPIQWSEQFGHKFIISVDGNGATCSRVVIVLKSNSVLLKYDSPHRLYHSHGLLPWRHYIQLALIQTSRAYSVWNGSVRVSSHPSLRKGANLLRPILPSRGFGNMRQKFSPTTPSMVILEKVRGARLVLSRQMEHPCHLGWGVESLDDDDLGKRVGLLGYDRELYGDSWLCSRSPACRLEAHALHCCRRRMGNLDVPMRLACSVSWRPSVSAP
jgi:hypothetical protein